MRNRPSLIAILALTACSLDHVVVAALDDASAGGAPAGGAPTGGAGSSSRGAGLSAGIASVIPSGGSRSQSDAGPVSITVGGAAGDSALFNLAGEGGTTSEIRCSCLGQQQGQFCGSDGITYPVECGDGGLCLPPAIDCWHACPCLDAGADNTGTTSWFSVDCPSATQCSDGLICMTFSNVARDALTTCTTTGN